MIRKFHEAKLNQNAPVKLWGSAKPMREFLHGDGMAQAVVCVLQYKLPEHLYNVGTGSILLIKVLAETMQRIVGHEGIIDGDVTKPNGTPRKLMDVSKLNSLGWKANTSSDEGTQKTSDWFLEYVDELRVVK